MHPPKGATDGPVSLKPRDPYFLWQGPDKNIPPEGHPNDAYKEWEESMKEDHDEKGKDDQEKGDENDEDKDKEDKRPTFFITYETM